MEIANVMERVNQEGSGSEAFQRILQERFENVKEAFMGVSFESYHNLVSNALDGMDISEFPVVDRFVRHLVELHPLGTKTEHLETVRSMFAEYEKALAWAYRVRG